MRSGGCRGGYLVRFFVCFLDVRLEHGTHHKGRYKRADDREEQVEPNLID
jgi:hypothetical protein